MMTLAQFTTELRKLGHAFGKEVSGEMTVQYYQCLGRLSENQLRELFKWAMENIDAPFPRIAMLMKHAKEEGWFQREVQAPQRRDYWVHVACPECGRSFVVKRSQLENDAKEGKSYQCVNREHWGCKGVVKASDVLAKEKSTLVNLQSTTDNRKA